MTGLFPAGVQAGQSVKVKLLGTVGDPAPQVWCSRTGITLAPGEKPNEWTLAAAADTLPGVAYVRFHNPEGASDLRPVYVGTIPEVLEVEPNNTLPQVHKIETLPVVVNGVLHKGGEIDGYAVTLETGQTLTAAIEAHRGLGSPMDGVLQIVSPAGFVLAQNDDDRGFDPLLTFTAVKPGSYIVRTFAFPAEPNSTINYAGAETYIYRLLLTTGPVLDHVVPLAVSVASPTPVQVFGTNVPREAVPLTPTLQDDQVLFPSKDPATLLAHRLPVVPHPIAVGASPPDASTPQMLAVPVCLTGHVAIPQEVDRYRFVGKKGDVVRLAVESRRFDSHLDPLLRLLAPDGKVLKEQDDEGRKSLDLDFTHKLPEDGEYGIEITDRFRMGGPRFPYLLTLEHPTPDFSLSVEANRWTLKAGTPLEIPIAITRTTGFKHEITFLVEGLPPDSGITVADAKSLPEGDTAKSVKLKLESQVSKTLDVPIRIVGRAASLTRRADALIGSLTDRTTHLWLTVPK